MKLLDGDVHEIYLSIIKWLTKLPNSWRNYLTSEKYNFCIFQVLINIRKISGYYFFSKNF